MSVSVKQLLGLDVPAEVVVVVVAEVVVVTVVVSARQAAVWLED